MHCDVTRETVDQSQASVQSAQIGWGSVSSNFLRGSWAPTNQLAKESGWGTDPGVMSDKISPHTDVGPLN